MIGRLYRDDTAGLASLASSSTILASNPDLLPLVGISQAQIDTPGAASLAAWMSEVVNGSDETVFEWFDANVADPDDGRTFEERFAEQIAGDGFEFLTSRTSAEWLARLTETQWEDISDETLADLKVAPQRGDAADIAAVQSGVALGIRAAGGALKVDGWVSDSFPKLFNFLGWAGPILGVAGAAVSVFNIAQWKDFADRREAHDDLSTDTAFDQRFKDHYQQVWGQELGFTIASVASTVAFAVAGVGLKFASVTGPVGLVVAGVGVAVGGLIELYRGLAYDGAIRGARDDLGGQSRSDWSEHWANQLRWDAEDALERKNDDGESLLDLVDDVLAETNADVVVHAYTQHFTPKQIEYAASVTEHVTYDHGSSTFTSTTRRDGLDVPYGSGRRVEKEMAVHGYLPTDEIDGYPKRTGAIYIPNYAQGDGTASDVEFITLSPLTSSSGIATGRYYDTEVLPFKGTASRKMADHLAQYYSGWVIDDGGENNEVANNTRFDLRSFVPFLSIDLTLHYGWPSESDLFYHRVRLDHEVWGRDGDDTVVAGAAAFNFYGGDGFDTVTYQGFTNEKRGQKGLQFEVSSKDSGSTIEVTKFVETFIADKVTIDRERYLGNGGDYVIERHNPETMTRAYSRWLDLQENTQLRDSMEETERVIGTEHDDEFELTRSFGTQLIGAGGNDLFVIDDGQSNSAPAEAEGHVRLIAGGTGDMG